MNDVRFSRLTVVGVSLGLAILSTGCGVLYLKSRLSLFPVPQSLAPKVLQSSDHTNPTQSTVKTVSLQQSTSQSSNSHPQNSVTPSSPYPSFGLGTTGPEVLALNERLAELGYLPVTIEGSAPDITLNNIQNPPQVTFVWKYGNIPSTLQNLWQPDTYTALTRAAVIAVEHVNNLTIDGIAGPAVWQAILSPNAVADPHRFTYVLVSKNPAPETLRIWKDGEWIYQSVCNTGIPGASTPDGTYAIYLRFQSQTMRGENPNGSKYVDPGIPDVNYFHGSDAIHGFIRASYGFPQSLGCVELPYAHAAQVWTLVHYGTLVTIRGHYVAPSSVSITTTSSSTSPSNQGSEGNTDTSHSQPSTAQSVYVQNVN